MKRIPSILLITCSLFVQGQNLVLNSSFEDTIQCPSFLSQIDRIRNWFQPTYGTCDFYHACSNPSEVGVPNNWDGFQDVRSGRAYMGFILFSKYNESREYIAVKLLSPLDAGLMYCVSFYVNLADSAEFAIDAIGAYLSTDSFSVANKLHLPYIPQIHNQNGKIITDTAKWTLIEGEFIASGSEQYITIGNFFNDSSTNVINVGGTSYHAYYYIDDVSVVLCDTPYCAGVIQPKVHTTKDTFLLGSATVQFTDSSRYASRWQWSFTSADSVQVATDTVQNPVHIFDSVGVYTVRLVAGYGNCTDTAEKIIVVEKEVSSNYELGIRNYDFSIYPNPTNGQFTITNNEHPIMNYEVKILNILGQTVYQQTLNTKQETLNTKLSEGIYFIQLVEDGNVIGTEKLVIIR